MDEERLNVPAEEEKTEAELLRELVRAQSSSLRHMRVIAVVAIVLAVALFAALWLVVPRMLGMMEKVNVSLTQMESFVQNADEFLRENTGTVSEVAEKIGEIDVERFNQAVDNLAEAAVPLARLGSLFSH